MIGIIHYKMGNITSVQNALDWLNVPAKIVTAADDLDSVSHIILPGVGAFPEGMKNLAEAGFVDAINRNVLSAKKPFLGICLGMQLLATVGHEGETTQGLNLIPGTVERLPDSTVHVPHIGWNNIQIARANSLIKTEADFYFVHSYYFQPTDSGDVIASADYGINFSAAVNRGNIYGVQFHPEKSQAAGLELLKNFSQL
ncbi:MAG: imidazole glycerol phosphate synthase subunit HisH [bacterium]|nr:imidazole glycerol phosphate synthase subunit HisH [bacterium]